MKKYYLILLILSTTGTADAQVTWGKQTLKRGKLWATLWYYNHYCDTT